MPALDIRGNMKAVLRTHFPDLDTRKAEAIAEQLANVARDYGLAMRDADRDARAVRLDRARAALGDGYMPGDNA